jgi:hypothetical protein
MAAKNPKLSRLERPQSFLEPDPLTQGTKMLLLAKPECGRLRPAEQNCMGLVQYRRFQCPAQGSMLLTIRQAQCDDLLCTAPDFSGFMQSSQ